MTKECNQKMILKIKIIFVLKCSAASTPNKWNNLDQIQFKM